MSSSSVPVPASVSVLLPDKDGVAEEGTGTGTGTGTETTTPARTMSPLPVLPEEEPVVVVNTVKEKVYAAPPTLVSSSSSSSQVTIAKPNRVSNRAFSMDLNELDLDALDNTTESSSFDNNKSDRDLSKAKQHQHQRSGSHNATTSKASASTSTSSSSLTMTTPVSTPVMMVSNKKGPLPFIPAVASRDNSDRIRLGICAMDKKARSKPMAEILSRLNEDHFQVVFFGDNIILNAPVEEWPVCNVVIAFFSKGYPLQKAKDYVKLRKPIILNDLDMQELLQDRRRVYDHLEASGIDVPRHIYLSRDGYVSTGTGDGNSVRDQEVQEFDDHIEVNGITIHKPFVEKPVNAEDHNIAIYYPTSAGGGCKKLFRKIGNRSSEFYPDINEVRRDGSYIYEEFVETQGTDVKMYTVGPEYGHAEARKSPAVDGKVQRNPDGKEVRFPVILTFREKEIARRIVLVFKQFVCGFDILRVQENRESVVSFVCDVNGWSFVKNSRKYYDDCAQILSEHILALAKPAALKTFSTLDPLVTTSLNRLDEEILEDVPRRKETFISRAARMLQGEPSEELAEVGDTHSLASQSGGDGPGDTLSPSRSETAELLSTAAATLVEGAVPVRELPNNLTSEPASMNASTASSVHDEEEVHPTRRRSSSIQGSHQEELRCVVAIIRHGDRTPKQKLKVNMTEPHILKFFHDHSKDYHKDLKVKAKAPMTEFLQTVRTTLDELQGPYNGLHYQLMHMRDILERWKIVGLNRKLQIKPRKFEEYTDENGETKERCTDVQLILKWGGNLTKLGEKQSINLGQRLRHEMYPDNPYNPGGGILRLHSTFRHDLKIKTSDEGRVMKTAAAFAKGLLELEGDLPPILVSLVHKEKGSMHMLDPSGNKEVKMELDECKEKITENMQRDIDVNTAEEADLEQLVGPPELDSLRDALSKLGNPRKMLFQIHQTMGLLISQLEEMLGAMGSGDEKRIEGGEGLQNTTDDDVALSGIKLYKGETLLELTERWRFIYDRLYDPDTDRFDLSRIPDVHDNVRFDVLHNPHLGLSSTLEKLYELAKSMADCVVPQEYGTTIEKKRSVGVKICRGLLEKLKYDLDVARTDNEVDMRYMINMDYSADLPINTMGRRIRTRLYFTSESHLHTVLNSFRYAHFDCMKPILSEHGISIINATPELCYLTQIVIRVFEDNRRDMKDPRRFRIEILFSPGATSTPLQLHELTRDEDASRFDTAPLQLIGREGLTCQEMEDFFEQAIISGRSEDEDSYEMASTSTAAEGMKKSKPKKEKSDKKKKVEIADPPSSEATSKYATNSESAVKETPPPSAPAPQAAVVKATLAKSAEKHPEYAPSQPEPTEAEGETVETVLPNTITHEIDGDGGGGKDDIDDTSLDKEKSERVYIARKYFWSAVSIGCLTVGVGCLIAALHFTEDARQRRRWTSVRRH